MKSVRVSATAVLKKDKKGRKNTSWPWGQTLVVFFLSEGKSILASLTLFPLQYVFNV